MCFGSKSSSNTTPPAPQQPTTFDYSVANRGQRDADNMVADVQAGQRNSSTAGNGPPDAFAQGLNPTGGV